MTPLRSQGKAAGALVLAGALAAACATDFGTGGEEWHDASAELPSPVLGAALREDPTLPGEARVGWQEPLTAGARGNDSDDHAGHGHAHH
jgi:hypothetical protein